MSYCRFQNTNSALRDCANALEDLIGPDGPKGEPLSRDELRAAIDLVAQCQDIVLAMREYAATEADAEEMESQEIVAALTEANEAVRNADQDDGIEDEE